MMIAPAVSYWNEYFLRGKMFLTKLIRAKPRPKKSGEAKINKVKTNDKYAFELQKPDNQAQQYAPDPDFGDFPRLGKNGEILGKNGEVLSKNGDIIGAPSAAPKQHQKPEKKRPSPRPPVVVKQNKKARTTSPTKNKTSKKAIQVVKSNGPLVHYSPSCQGGCHLHGCL
jgi:hypothetical protein